jgi:hypothetical protein
VGHFLLYDFYTSNGTVNEDVFAYSNRAGDERSLVLYHNKYNSTAGWIRTSAAYNQKTGPEQGLVQRKLGEGLALPDDPAAFVIFRDHVTQLQYIRNCREIHEKGLFAELNAYQFNVYLDFQEVWDNEWGQYAQLADFLGGRGVPNIDEALKEVFLQPILGPFRELVNAGSFRWLIDNRAQADGRTPKTFESALDEAEEKILALLREVRQMTGGLGDETHLAAEIRNDLKIALRLPALQANAGVEQRNNDIEKGSLIKGSFIPYLDEKPDEESALGEGDLETWSILFAWVFSRKLGRLLSKPGGDSPEESDPADYALQSRSWLDEWLLGKQIARTIQELGYAENKAWRAVTLLKVLIEKQGWCWSGASSSPYELLQDWLKDRDVQGLVKVNRYQGVLWFNKESFEEIIWWLFTTAGVDILASEMRVHAARYPNQEFQFSEEAVAEMDRCFAVIRKLRKAEEASGFQIDRLLEALR